MTKFGKALWLAGVMACSVALAQSDANRNVHTPAKDLNEETVHIPVTVQDIYSRTETKSIPVVIYRPAGAGPYPVVIFNHGRATSDKRAKQGISYPETTARYFVEKGFVVLAPIRVGYAETYGPFDPEDSGSCSTPRIEPLSMAKYVQVMATLEYAKSLAYADTSHWIVAGQSAGGEATIATVGQNPPGLMAGINFAGGNGGDPDKSPGRPCAPQAIAHYYHGIAKNDKVPTLWMYWQNDKFWGEEIPKQWHAAWVEGGGQGEFHSFPPSGDNGHFGQSADMDHWLPVVDKFLQQLGFTKPAIVAKPLATGYADIADLSKAPLAPAKLQAAYTAFVAHSLPRAFAIGSTGGFGFAYGDYATGRALGNCRHFGHICKLYAVDNDVVWADK